jgi:hypothetical protein
MKQNETQWGNPDGSIYTLRGLIMQRAEKMDCVEDIKSLSDLNAVRFIQKKEGYTPCFGGDAPLHNRGSVDPRRCGELNCDWRRRISIAPLSFSFTTVLQKTPFCQSNPWASKFVLS